MVRSTLFAAMLLAASATSLPVTYAMAQTSEQISQTHELTQQNKELVKKAYQALFGDHDLGALDLYWSDTYIQHNPYMADGRQGVRDFMSKMGYLNGPKQKIEFLRVIAENDLVMLHTRTPAYGNTPEMVFVDIFRVENGKIAEHWDVIQPVPADKSNPRTIY